jgi:membrane protein YdbS with pleckstrin-like domain
MTTAAPSSGYKAAFNPLIRPYLVLYVGAALAGTIVGLPLAIVWFCGVGQWWARHYFDHLECELRDTAIRYRKGILVQIEKTIPLENIQDVTFIEGPLLRRFNLSVLKFETAGQSAGQANDMKLIGVIDAQNLRARILERREQLRRQHAAPASAPAASDDSVALLRSILGRLDEIAQALRRRG